MTTSAPEIKPQAGTFADAVAAWRAGALDEARTRCARLIAANAQDADAWHLAGILETARDRRAARTLIERALALREDPNFLVSLALTYDPATEAQGAFAALERALAIRPDFSIALNNLANLYTAQGDFPRALAAFERALALTPDYAGAHYNYGSALFASGDAARAEAPLRRAVALDAGYVNAWNNLANVLIALQRTDEAMAALDHARTLTPESADVLTNLGCLLRARGRHAEAQAALERALVLAPRNASAWNNLGNVLVDLSRIDAARAAFTRALELKPRFASAWSNLGNAHKHAGDIESALASYREALACEPGSIGAHSNYVYALMFATDDGHTIRSAAGQLSAQHEAALLAQPVAHATVPDAVRRLRIGYVSPDFRTHCQMLFTTPLFHHHDHAAFEIVCYSSVASPDEVTARLAAHADLWRDVREFDDARLAQQIHADRIDILVDLTMHMDGARRLMFARRPAPVQVAWLAYPGTTGSAAIGWRLTDPWLDPVGAPGVDDQYTERSLRLPDAFWCYDALAPGIEVTGLPALAAGHDGHLTFGCLNNPCKLTGATLALWAGVFAALPTARLVLMAPPGAARERLVARLGAPGRAWRRCGARALRGLSGARGLSAHLGANRHRARHVSLQRPYHEPRRVLDGRAGAHARGPLGGEPRRPLAARQPGAAGAGRAHRCRVRRDRGVARARSGTPRHTARGPARAHGGLAANGRRTLCAQYGSGLPAHVARLVRARAAGERLKSPSRGVGEWRGAAKCPRLAPRSRQAGTGCPRNCKRNNGAVRSTGGERPLRLARRLRIGPP
ncbi:glycosyltransferase family 41 protein [Paraburkholderia pallida]|uniref:protein O-GlcNAc transferase n=1 Tax=Paraburkholderia pallida TaxID=2547399 RepID=A0A4P7CQ54_9BURK|nr:glycosyltransferase family 41 protein [Paraburkholderia pallida]QBQ96384.1 glycosyltransferase family 41 protein [Paraburkholderia pallida]